MTPSFKNILPSGYQAHHNQKGSLADKTRIWHTSWQNENMRCVSACISWQNENMHACIPFDTRYDMIRAGTYRCPLYVCCGLWHIIQRSIFYHGQCTAACRYHKYLAEACNVGWEKQKSKNLISIFQLALMGPLWDHALQTKLIHTIHLTSI